MINPDIAALSTTGCGNGYTIGIAAFGTADGREFEVADNYIGSVFR